MHVCVCVTVCVPVFMHDFICVSVWVCGCVRVCVRTCAYIHFIPTQRQRLRVANVFCRQLLFMAQSQSERCEQKKVKEAKRGMQKVKSKASLVTGPAFKLMQST